MKNLLNPTPQQVKLRNKMWADALRKNKKKATNSMYDNGGRCCLAVAQNVASACGVNVDKSGSNSQPDDLVGDFFGWYSDNPYLDLPNETSQEAATVNDDDRYAANGSRGMSHKRIAECVENTFVHPSKKKWTFKLD